MLPLTRTRLEVIVTTAEEAREAEAGGADCLEIVRELELGGLTPSIAEVARIVAAVSIPARAMLRHVPRSERIGRGELTAITESARALADLSIDGLVLGFTANGEVDVEVLERISQVVPKVAITFHRAFEELSDPLAAIRIFRAFGQIDRILVSIADSRRGIDLHHLRCWQAAASPGIDLIAGVGLRSDLLAQVRADPALRFAHVGRFAREGHTVFGAVSRTQVARLKDALA